MNLELYFYICLFFLHVLSEEYEKEIFYTYNLLYEMQGSSRIVIPVKIFSSNKRVGSNKRSAGDFYILLYLINSPQAMRY